jgi:predicted dehydrogenase
VLACCNKENRERLAQMGTQYPDVTTTQNIAEVWEDHKVDAVVVATPDETHFEIARQGLASGKHVFVEKPLSLSLEETTELVRFAEAQGKTLMAGHILVYHPAVQWIKERISGTLIKPVSVLSTRIEFGVARAGADLLWSSVVHDISVMQYVFGVEPKEIHAIGTSLTPGGLHDTLFINLLFPGGVVGHIHAGCAGPYRERRLVMHASNHIVVVDGVTGALDVFSRARLGVSAGEREYDKRFDDGVRVELMRSKDPLTVECEHFLECIRRRTVPLSGGEGALGVARTLDRITKQLAFSTAGTRP